jgi:malonyl-CoA decarboxylase
MAGDDNTGFLDRTLTQISNAWKDIAGRGKFVRPDLPDDDRDRLREAMAECLEGRGGEVSARARAADLGRAYLTLDATGRSRFLSLMADDFATDGALVDQAIAAVAGAEDAEARMRAESALSQALVSPRVKLLKQFNGLPQGIKFLVDLRGDLLQIRHTDPALRALDADLKELLRSWFDIGFLKLERITWDAPATLLEKLMAYEAVHEIQSWDDLKNRLDSDRRCFAFFHPHMPNEPLIFVEVALVAGMADNIQALLDEQAPRSDIGNADTAIFYSISNAQLGLSGISFGGFLIKRVVDSLAEEDKNLKKFATLSPIPGFRAWLNDLLEHNDETLLTATEAKALAKHAFMESGNEALRSLLKSAWHEDDTSVALLKRPLCRLCARYLLDAKVDPVARFHLRNGAGIERINWLADISRRGLDDSAGMMVNYLYRLDKIEANHEAFTGEGRINASKAVRAMEQAK